MNSSSIRDNHLHGTVGEYAIPAEGCRVIGVCVALTRGKGGL